LTKKIVKKPCYLTLFITIVKVYFLLSSKAKVSEAMKVIEIVTGHNKTYFNN